MFRSQYDSDKESDTIVEEESDRSAKRSTDQQRWNLAALKTEQEQNTTVMKICLVNHKFLSFAFHSWHRSYADR